MPTTITVYTKPHCGPCGQTKRLLDSRKVDYTPVDLTDNPEAQAIVVSLGYRGAPVVVTDDEHWYGFRPDKILGLTPRPEPLPTTALATANERTH